MRGWSGTAGARHRSRGIGWLGEAKQNTVWHRSRGVGWQRWVRRSSRGEASHGLAQSGPADQGTAVEVRHTNAWLRSQGNARSASFCGSTARQSRHRQVGLPTHEHGSRGIASRRLATRTTAVKAAHGSTTHTAVRRGRHGNAERSNAQQGPATRSSLGSARWAWLGSARQRR